MEKPIQNAIPMPFFGTTPFAAPGLGILASLIMLAFGLWWLNRVEAIAKRNGEGFGDGAPMPAERLATDEPPYFLSPLNAGWKVSRLTAPTEG